MGITVQIPSIPFLVSVYKHAQRDNGRPSMIFGFVYKPSVHHLEFETASFTRKREGNILVPFLSSIFSNLVFSASIKLS